MIAHARFEFTDIKELESNRSLPFSVVVSVLLPFIHSTTPSEKFLFAFSFLFDHEAARRFPILHSYTLPITSITHTSNIVCLSPSIAHWGCSLERNTPNIFVTIACSGSCGNQGWSSFTHSTKQTANIRHPLSISMHYILQ